MPESAKEVVQTTALIKGILNGYPGNSAIFREYLQNSDDAKATEQIFILDEKQYLTQSLFDPVLEDTQGPALIAVNNGVLLDADWTALKNIHASSKTTDENQTGKNGLGFRTSYHVTENPQVFSGEKLMILDPHHEFKDYPGGMDINVLSEGATYADQLAPFKSVVKDINQKYEGTAFRLPLRTEKQAKRSQIKPGEPTSVNEIRDLLLSFASDELEHTVLFLKNIKMIEICHIDEDGVQEFFGRVRVQDITPSQAGLTVRRTTLERRDNTIRDRDWFFHHRAFDKAEATSLLSKRLKYEIGDALTTEKLTPSIGIACPVVGENPIHGSLYTLLPLPIKTGFPVHLNAIFALTPDRQGLKNRQEVGLHRSRERRLVEWNRLIFDEYAPKVWADLLTNVTKPLGSSACWTAWPSQGFDGESYWRDLPQALVREIIQRDVAVFPTIGESRFVSLSDSQILIAPANAPLPLESLASLGLDLVQPPPHIHRLLQAAKLRATFLSPQRLHEVLVERYSRGSRELPGNKETGNKEVFPQIMDYLVFSSNSPSYSRVTGLPWFYLSADSTPITLSSTTGGSKYFVPASKEEADVFANHPRMISYGCMSSRLRNALISTSANNILNVTFLGVADVLSYLTTNGPTEKDVDWVIRFWDWVSQWISNKRFFSDLLARGGSLSLLPTASGTLRRVSDKLVSFEDTDQTSVEAWNRLGVYGPHDLLSKRVVSMLKEKSLIIRPCSPSYVPCLLQSCDVALLSTLTPTPSFRDSVYNGLPRRGKLSPWTPAHRSVLERFPIFSVRDNTNSGRSSLQCVHGSRVHTALHHDNFPLPMLKRDLPVVYVDVSDYMTTELVQLLEQVVPKDVFDLLTLAVDHWSDQKSDLQDKFVEQIIQNWYRAPVNLKAKLTDLPFVTVDGVDHRVPPQGLINPKSALTVLYAGETGKVPTGRFKSDEYISVMQSAGFFSSSLTDGIVAERLSYLSSAPLNPVTIEKSRRFLKQLNRNWNPTFSDLVRRHRASRWLPGPATLLAPDASRDKYVGKNANPYFYDFPLIILPNDTVHKPELRSALGWAEAIPLEILVEQLCCTLKLPNGRQRVERLGDLIEYLSGRFLAGHFAANEMNTLRGVVHDQSWIPISNEDTVSSRFALLEESGLKPPFKQVRQVEISQFLREMGCHDRPLLTILLEELEKLQNPRSSEVGLVISLLQEISKYHTDVDKSLLWILGRDSRGHLLQDLYFPDVDQLYIPNDLEDKFATHHAISRELSDALGIQSLSALILNIGIGDDSDDEEQMTEDLPERIRGFLREYDARYAFNEFLANADDAGAKEFSIRIEEPPSRPSQVLQVISPELGSFYGYHSLILHNDSRLSEADFKGLRRVGTGGKLGQLNTHGMHGLGALSFYYFTDVAIVISGKYVMILDPSGRHLPRARGGGKRTALRRTLGSINSRYLDQLAPYDGILNFSVKENHYNGTLFCLPLSSTIRNMSSSICERPCDLTSTYTQMNQAYRDLARNAFYFTNLERISAWHRSQNIWQMSASRSALQELQDRLLTRQEVRIQIGDQHASTSREDWIVSTSCGYSIPSDHKSTAISLKLNPEGKMKVQLAIKLPSHGEDRHDHGTTKDHYPFSTLCLPKTTSLPFHLNARFAISSNRQNLVFAPPDSSGNRDAKSSFNAWVLNTIVPPLYMATLEHLVGATSNTEQRPFSGDIWWLTHPRDEISKSVSVSFVRGLPASNARLFETTAGGFVSFQESIFSRDEPPKVYDLLNSVRARGIVSIFHHSRLLVHHLKHLKSLKTVDPAYVKGALLHVNPATIQQQPTGDGSGLEDQIKVTLAYVSGERPLAGLPLAILTSGKLVSIPGLSDPPIYFAERSHSSLFPTTRFLRANYDPETIKALLDDQSAHVIKLAQDTVMPLFIKELDRLPDDDSRKCLLVKFWRSYSTLPGPPDLLMLERSEYRIVQGISHTLSLKECQPGQVLLLNTTFSDANWILSVAQKLGIDVVNVDSNTALRDYLSKRFSDDLFANLLQCMETKHVSLGAEDITEEERDRLCHGFARHLHAWRRREPPIDKSYLRGLHIWKSSSTSGNFVSAACDLAHRVLPSFFSLASIVDYLLPGHVISEYSNVLTDFLSYTDPSRRNASTFVMSPADLLGVVSLPYQVSTQWEQRIFKDFLHGMLGFRVNQLSSTNLPVPDTDGVLRLFSDLHDHSISLFSATLKFNPTPSFIHEDFRNTSRLSIGIAHKLGLRHEVNLSTFRVCAQAVQRAFEMHTLAPEHPTRAEVCKMARIIFNQYRTVLPSKIMTNRTGWDSLDRIAFVRRNDSRRRRASYYVEPYCAQLRLIMAPSKLLIQKYEPVAWTQRALFLEDEEPQEEILAVHSKLGMPEVQEVVEHLRILAKQVARDHPNDCTLIFDLKATYDWLNECAEQAREYLAPLSHERLFLNVVNPITDIWDGQWAAAEEMVVNMHYDTSTKRRVKSFLLTYDALLQVAGCGILNLQFDREEHFSPATDGAPSNLRDKFDKMRKNGQYLDVVFVRSSPKTEEFRIPAHRAFVAATIPHFHEKTSQGGDAQNEEFEFAGTKFGAKAVVDFIYTGDFQIATPRDNAEDYRVLLRDLLGLLPISHQWGIDEMKARIEWSIIHKYAMIQRFPDAEAFDMMLQEAKAYGAERLEEALNEFKCKNRDFISWRESLRDGASL